jgi:hypothetical protein
MRRIVEKHEDKYKVTDVVEMETLTGEKVEVIKGTTFVEKEKAVEYIKNNKLEIAKLEELLSNENIDKQIEDYKNDVDGNIEMFKDHNKILEEILVEIEKLG